ncbi:hypothetical protein J1614_009433 [Plenodomus biglobosus]|nr:hypothetical protein J1614_009433 [Plenodomus biglobosus]
MDPFRNSALQSAKLQLLLSSSLSTHHRAEDQASPSDMPAPPAYHMVVDPHAPIPNNHSPYDPEDREEEKDEDDDDTPEVTINAATQVRGHGNIISIAQMDTVRIANLIATMLNGEPAALPSTPLQKLADAAAAACPQPTASTTTPTSPTPSTSTPPPHQPSSQIRLKPAHPLRKINITLNCGATIIGDRNIVGPGLGDIARQMQVAQRNQALQAQQNAAQQAQATGLKSTLPGAGVGTGVGLGGLGLGGAQRRDTLFQAQAAIAQHHGMMYQAHVHTPPMSRSASEKSDEVGSGGCGGKRKRDGEEGAGEGRVKRQF